MKLKLCVYNMEWMKDLFFKDGTPKKADEGSVEDRKHGERSKMLAAVIRGIDPDFLGIVEGPDTLADGSKTASQQLEAWRDLHGLDADYRGVHGFPSGGQQELCALYKKSKVSAVHDPEKEKPKHPFNKPFLVDTTDSLVKEQFKHYRPPLELSLRNPVDGGAELARVIVAHTKSKGIFDSVDLARFEQLSERNRRKLYGECFSIRERCDQWLKDNAEAKVVVVGDINDGFGIDYYEQRFSRSAVEILLGDVWRPKAILQQVLPRPKLGKYGWAPSSSRYRDRITGDLFNVLIDHILVSQSITFDNAMVWNPFPKDAPDEVKSLKNELRDASDHFPVSCELEV
ncbi:MAG: hypothetical protein ABJZ55_10195 [Fuerstiella sp.]